jgi:branched-chain amino acid transport system ATP-binding protein
MEHLVAGYGDLRAVWDLSLQVHGGRVTVVLGSNGAGKTTALGAVAGIVRQMGGSIRFLGEDIGSLPASQRTARGLALVQEGKRVFRDRTVEQNLRIGGWTLPRPRRRKIDAAIEVAYQRFPILAERRRAKAGSLSGGQQQMLAIAQALIPGPKVVMLDEPSAGLAPIVLAEVLHVVDQLRHEGYGVLLVEQLVDTAMSVADDVVVIERGRVAHSGTAASIDDIDLIRRAYLGQSTAIHPSPANPTLAPSVDQSAGGTSTAQKTGEHR